MLKPTIISQATGMKLFLLVPLALISSCSNQAKQTEEDRRNLALAQFFYEQDVPSKSIAHARKIKPDSPQYPAAQELMFQAAE